jgi:hypothetical protein
LVDPAGNLVLSLITVEIADGMHSFFNETREVVDVEFHEISLIMEGE